MPNVPQLDLSVVEPRISRGRVLSISGMLVKALLPQAAVGEIAYISNKERTEIPAVVTGFQEEVVSLAPFNAIQGIAPGAAVRSNGQRPSISIPENPRGMVLDCTGKILNQQSNLPPEPCARTIPLLTQAPAALSRRRCRTQVITGVDSIDLFTPIAYGQRIGIFASAGSGKSTLLGMIARHIKIDSVVIGLIGERGREVREFIEDTLGSNGLTTSTVVVSTSDEPAIRRVLAANAATAIAEYQRDQGKDVLLIVDSLTRVARAMREVGLAAGEIPVRNGYPASVYAELPRLLERSGCGSSGSITAIYSVLQEGEESLDPISEEIQSLLDGHLRLNRELSLMVRPAIDFTNSVSRLYTKLLNHQEQLERAAIIKMLDRLKRDKDILLLGGVPDQELKSILDLEPRLIALLQQEIDQSPQLVKRLNTLKEIIAQHNQCTN